MDLVFLVIYYCETYLPPLPEDDLEEPDDPEDPREGALLPLERDGDEILGLDDLDGGGLLLLEGLETPGLVDLDGGGLELREGV